MKINYNAPTRFSRRDMLKLGGTALAGAACHPLPSFAADIRAAERKLVRPSPAQIAWQDCEVGVLYHFDLPVAAGNYSLQDASRKTFDPNLYQPKKLDTDQWLTAAKSAGAKYAIFTATHFNGFMQWQSGLYPYGLKQTSWRNGTGDVVGDFVASCRKVGITPGIYFSVNRNAFFGVYDHYVDGGKGRGTPAQEKFNHLAEKMTEELCSRYGPLIELWFDAGTKTPEEGGPDVLPIFEKHQPNAVFYHSAARGDHRWIGIESGFANYPCWATMPDRGQTLRHNTTEGRKLLATGDPDGPAWSPGMVDVPLRGVGKIHSWIWTPDEEHAIQPADVLVRMYHESAGRNCNFIIGAVIDRDGLVPKPDAKRLGEFGTQIKRRYGRPLAETKGEGSVVELKLRQPMNLDAFLAMEDITQGERVREYRLDGLAAGGEWRKLCDGQSIGHKRIQEFPRLKVSVVRIQFTKFIATPKLSRLAVFDTSTL